MTKKYVDEISYEIIGAAIEVHKSLGPGLLESVYLKCLKYELEQRNLDFECEWIVPVTYKGMEFDTQLRCDLFVENCVVVELKSAKELIPVYEAQLITYMKLLKAPKGVLINFNCVNIFKEGQKTFVNELYKLLS